MSGFFSAPMETDMRPGFWFSNDVPFPFTIAPCVNFPNQYGFPSCNNNFFGVPASNLNMNTMLDCRMNNASAVQDDSFGVNRLNSVPTTCAAFSSPEQGSIKVKFLPTKGKADISRYQCITTMPEYVDKSLEELRLEDYKLGKMFPDTKPTFGGPEVLYAGKSSYDTILDHMSGFNRPMYSLAGGLPVDIFGGRGASLLQALLSNIKNRFNINCISQEARISCETLANKLLVFTEKTMENLTVVILEDLLNSIKYQSGGGNGNVTEKASNRGRSPLKKNYDVDKKSIEQIHFKNDKKTKSSEIYVSYDEDSDSHGEDVVDRTEEAKECCQSPSEFNNTKKNVKKSSSNITTDHKDSSRRVRHCYQFSGKFKARSKGCLKKSRDCKCNCEDVCENLANDGSTRKEPNTNQREDRSKKPLSSTKSDSFILRNKKKLFKKNSDGSDILCYLCEHMKAISTKSQDHAECTHVDRKEQSVCKKKREKKAEHSEYDDDNETDHATTDKFNTDDLHLENDIKTEASSSINVSAEAEELQSSSDSSSI